MHWFWRGMMAMAAGLAVGALATEILAASLPAGDIASEALLGLAAVVGTALAALITYGRLTRRYYQGRDGRELAAPQTGGRRPETTRRGLQILCIILLIMAVSPSSNTARLVLLSGALAAYGVSLWAWYRHLVADRCPSCGCPLAVKLPDTCPACRTAIERDGPS